MIHPGRTRRAWLLGAVAVLISANAQAQSADAANGADRYWSLLDSYCNDCHNFEDWAGGVAFDTMSPDAVPEDAGTWEAALRKLRGRLMPPPGTPQPDQQQIDEFVGWMEASLDDAHANGPVAGHVPIQRLNRTEYATAVRGLLGVEIDGRDYLPQEIEVHGFDNIAAALSVSPSFLDQFVSAARGVARLAVGGPRVASVRYPSPGGAQATFEDGLPLGTRGGMVFRHNFPADGEYRMTVLGLDAGLYPRGIETEHTLLILIGGEEVFRGSVGGPSDLALVDREGVAGAARLMERFTDIPAQVPAGMHDVVVTFIERSRAESDEPVVGGFGGGTRLPRVLGGVDVVGPFEPSGVSRTASRERVFVCEPQAADDELACAERIAGNLARRAYRRPVTAEDIDALMPFFEAGRQNQGGSFDAGIEQVVAAVLASPDFLYRVIVPPAGIEDAADYALSDLELASRLSFFLWSQGPDDELIELAAAGGLSEPQVLDAQVRRMLDDRRASALVNNFALRWLNLADLDSIAPDPTQYPGFSEALRRDFATEMELFLGSILLEDRSVLKLLTAEHTYLNERLARHYGIASVHGPQFRRVSLEDERRHGLFGKGAVLLRTSYGDRTSPVLRGAWVLEMMGTPPAPPPPEVETDLSIQEGETPRTAREQLERHREEPSCNACHGVIDPIGLALENFDVIGRWRDVDLLAGEAIDASTVLPTGAAVNGPADLRRELLRQPDLFVQALTEKLMMYGLGRELAWHDMPQVRAVVRAAAKDGYRLSAIVSGIVSSDAFRKQRHRPGDADPADVLATAPVHDAWDGSGT